VRDILRCAVSREGEPRLGLGSRVARRFAGIGLDAETEELRGNPTASTGSR